MPKGYIVASIDVTDPERYKDYIAANAEPLAAFGGRFLVRGGRQEAPEGTRGPRTVVVEFESYDKARAFYHSPEYQHAAGIRQEASRGSFVLVEGYDGPRPAKA